MEMSSVFCERQVMRVGDLFKDRRVMLGRSSAEVSKELNIPVRYLEALEDSDYCSVPLPFTKPWLRSYAKSLGLVWERVEGLALKEWESRQRHCALKSIGTSGISVQPLFTRSRLWVAAMAIGALGILYLVFVVVLPFIPPPLAIERRALYSQTREPALELVVRSAPFTAVSFNGSVSPTDARGQVHVPIVLHDGSNTLVLRAKRPHSAYRVVEYTIVLVK